MHNVDLKKAESEEREGDKGQVIPLLLQNKPPVREDGKETGELADLSMRPESVSCVYNRRLKYSAISYD